MSQSLQRLSGVVASMITSASSSSSSSRSALLSVTLSNCKSCGSTSRSRLTCFAEQVNITACFLACVGAAVLTESPLSAIQVITGRTFNCLLRLFNALNADALGEPDYGQLRLPGPGNRGPQPVSAPRCANVCRNAVALTSGLAGRCSIGSPTRGTRRCCRRPWFAT